MAMAYFKPATDLIFKSVVAIRAKIWKMAQDKCFDGLCIDLSDVQHCDSAGLALLLEAKKLCVHYGKSFLVKGSSVETQSLAEFCGVKSILSEHEQMH